MATKHSLKVTIGANFFPQQTIKETGHRFRETILALGGRSPLEVFIDFRGRKPSADPLLRHNGLLPVTASA